MMHCMNVIYLRKTPELVNAIVSRVCKEPDNDGFSAAVLDMVRKGHLSFIEKSGEVVGLKLIDDDTSRPILAELWKLSQTKKER